MQPKKYEGLMSENIKVTILEQNISQINETLKRIEQNMYNMNQDIKHINDRLWSNFLWLLSAISGLGLIMAHGFHWF